MTSNMLKEGSASQSDDHRAFDACFEDWIGADSLDRLVGEIYQGPYQRRPWRQALALMRDTANADHAALWVRSPLDDKSGVTFHAEGSNPALHRLLEPLSTTLVVDSNAMPSEEEPYASHSDEARALSEAFRGRFPISENKESDSSGRVAIRELHYRVVLVRASSSGSVYGDEKVLCQLLHHHVRRSLELSARLAVSGVIRDIYAGAISRLSLGVIAIGPSNTIVTTNREAGRILDEKDGLRRVRGRLVVDIQQESNELSALLQEASDQSHPEYSQTLVGTLSVTRSRHPRPLRISVRALPRPRSPRSCLRPTAALYVTDLSKDRARADDSVVRRLFGLTAMEASLAIRLVEGLSLEEAGQSLGIRRNTVRTHLRGIYSKTGVRSQAGLLSTLLKSAVYMN